MKNILFINHSNHLYGAETVLLAGIKALSTKENRNNIYVLLPKEENSQTFINALQTIKVTNYFSLPYKPLGLSLRRSLLVLIFNVYSVIKLIHFIKKNKIDILYSNTSITGIGIITAIVMKKQHIWHIHESAEWSDFFPDRKILYIYKYLMTQKRNKTVFVSNVQRKQWENFIGKTIENYEIIYNPIKKFSKIDNANRKFNDYLVYGYLGNLAKQKNIPALIDTFYELQKTVPNCKLLIGGDGDQRNFIEQMIQGYSLEKSVTLLGHISDVSSFYSQIDVFVLPSLCDTWPLVTIEAMSFHKAAITTIYTGLPELFENGKECIFIDPKNKQELLDAMRSLVNPKYRETLAANGYKKICQCDFNAQFEKSFKEVFTA